MKCQQPGCSNEAVWAQMTIFDEDQPVSALREEHYCRSCMAALGGTYKDVPAAGNEPRDEYVSMSG